MSEANRSAAAEKMFGDELRREAQALLYKLNDVLRSSSSFQAALLHEYLMKPSYLEQRTIHLTSGGFDFSVQYQSEVDRIRFSLVRSMNGFVIQSVGVTVPTEGYLQPARVMLFEGKFPQKRYSDDRYSVEAASEMIKALPA